MATTSTIIEILKRSFKNLYEKESRMKSLLLILLTELWAGFSEIRDCFSYKFLNERLRISSQSFNEMSNWKLKS